MKKFSIEKLPSDVKEKIEFIEWNENEEFDEEVCGQVWLKEGFVFGNDESSVSTFDDRSDLIALIRWDVVKEG